MSERSLSRRDVLVGAGACGGAAAIGLLGPSAVAVAARDRPEEFDAAVPAAWFDLALVLVRTTPGFTPPVASRAFGYAGVALYEAVVPGSRRYRSLAPVLPGLRGSRGDTAICIGRRSPTRRWRGSCGRCSPPPATPTRRRSTTWSLFADDSRARLARSTWRRRWSGAATVARVVFDWSRRDGGHEGYLRNFPPDYVPPVVPGLWVPTPPGFQPALQPSWGVNRAWRS